MSEPAAGAISTVLFDVGGVLMDSPFAMMAPVAAAHGIDLRTFAAIAVGAGVYDDGAHPWHRYERGEITEAELNLATNELAKGRGYDGFPPLPDGSIMLVPAIVRPSMLDLVRSCRHRGLKTGIITNNVEAWTMWRDLFPLAELFDDVIDSWEVGMRKPEARIYELAASRLGVPVTACLFLDDFPENITGAQALGMATVLVGEPDAAIAEVTALLGL